MLARLIKKVVLFLGLLTVVLVLTYFGLGFLTRNHRLGAAKIKHDRLTLLKEPKLILVGGSNLHYGMDSKLLEDSMDMKVVNMGLQASIGLRYYFEEIYAEVGPGDLVVLLGEIAHYFVLPLGGESALFNMLSKYPSGFAYLSKEHWWRFPRELGASVKENLQYLFQLGLMKTFGKSTIYEDTNHYGDYEGHRDKVSIFRPIEVKGNFSIDSIPSEILQLLKEAEQEIEMRGAQLLIGFSPNAVSSVDPELVILQEQELRRTFGHRVIGSAEAYVFPDSFFYDTPHHLLYDKRKMRTLMLIGDLKLGK